MLIPADVRRWAALTRAAFSARRTEIDALNVYPVPDGDTGTNLYLTLDAALDDIRDVRKGRAGGERSPGAGVLSGEARDLAEAMLLTGRGNSGVILGQLVRGFTEVIVERGAEVIDADTFAAGLERAAVQARHAVDQPVEGTILTVVDAAAAAARGAVASGAGLADVVAAVTDTAEAALDRTPDQLPALAAAGVVDAGGAGFVLAMSTLRRIVDGTADGGSRRPDFGPAPGPAPEPANDAAPGTGPAYEVMYLVGDTTQERIDLLRAALADLGDSVVIGGGPDVWNIHVHVDDPGAAVEAGVEAGRPSRIRITRLEDRSRGDEPEPAATDRTDGIGVVACTAGPGMAALVEAEGARAVPSGPGHRASAGELLEAARSTRARHVIILPNDKDTIMAAHSAAAAARAEGMVLHVVRSRTVVQGLAALAVFDERASVADNVVVMTDAAAATRHGGVTIATREALTSGGRCRVGDALGIVQGDIVIVGDDLSDVARRVAHRLLSSGGELLTLVLGAEAGSVDTDDLVTDVEARWPGTEVTVIDGGQEHYPLLMGVE